MPRNKTERAIYRPKDNKTFLEKSRLRHRMLERLETAPVILETHGGQRRLCTDSCYAVVKTGLVFETDRGESGETRLSASELGGL